MENHENEIIKELQNISKELQGIKRKGLKQVFSIIIAVIVSIAIGIGGGIYINRNWDEIIMTLNPGAVAQETMTIIEEKLNDEAKLVTASDTIKANYDSGKIYKTVFGKKVPLSSKSFSFTYTGTGKTAGRFYVLSAVYSLFLLSFKIRSIILFETPVNLFN